MIERGGESKNHKLEFKNLTVFIGQNLIYFESKENNIFLIT